MSEKYVMVLRHEPGRRYFLISVKAEERVGALADLSRLLAVRGFDVLEGHVFVDR